MIDLMRQLYNNPMMEFKLENPKIIKIDSILKIKEKHYSILTYSNLMSMKINPEDTNESSENKKMRIGLLKASFYKSFGAENVNYDDETDFFKINVVKNVCSVSKNGVDTWKFVTLEEDQRYILEKFIPKEIFERI